MDSRPMATARSSLVCLCANIARAIKNVTEKYNAVPTRSSISAECSAISVTLMDTQSLLSQPHALLSRAMSQSQLKEALKNAQNSCNSTVSCLEEEAGKCIGFQAIMEKSPLCNEDLIKGLLQQIQRQLTDINLLIAAAQR